MCTPCVCACRGKTIIWVPFIECWPLFSFLMQDLSLTWGLPCKARLAAQSTPRIHLSLSTQHWGTTLTFSFWRILGIELRSSCLQGQYFINQDIYPALILPVMLLFIFFCVREALMECVNKMFKEIVKVWVPWELVSVAMTVGTESR